MVYKLEGMNIIEGQNPDATPQTTPTPKPTNLVISHSGLKQGSLEAAIEAITDTHKQSPSLFSLNILFLQLQKDLVNKKLTEYLINKIKVINGSKEILYNETDSSKYLDTIKNMDSLLELGDPKNSDELDFMEHVIIKFNDISDNELHNNLMNDFCNGDVDLNINIMLILAIFYHKNDKDFIIESNVFKVDTILNRLSRYLPDTFQKIINVMKLCYPDDPYKYIILDNIYGTMFKYNNTTVNFDFFTNFKKFINYISTLKTIEMIVVIIAIAFVVSKIFDMFRVKVEV